MLWYNNPDGVTACHERAMEDRQGARRRRAVLRLERGTGPDLRH